MLVEPNMRDNDNACNPLAHSHIGLECRHTLCVLSRALITSKIHDCHLMPQKSPKTKCFPLIRKFAIIKIIPSIIVGNPQNEPVDNEDI